jgi:glycosyltransferase involved in cell wall biosynthesis
LPFDRRVWQEAHVLKDAGATVSIICPKSAELSKSYELIDGIHIHRHSLPLEASGKTAFLLEYAAALFWETLLAWKIFFTRGFDVIQGCNPPDLIFLVALPFKLFGKRFVFDHHDSAPELYLAKFDRRDAFYKLLCVVERLTFRTASRVITANESYRQHAIAIGPHPATDVTAVYSVPELSRIRRVTPDPVLRAKADTILGYVGIIADQDGLDHLVEMMRALADLGGTANVHAVVVGDGPALASVKALAVKLGVDHLITFAGYLRGEALLGALSCFDIGIIPDPVNPYNDKISMNKVFEYSALGVPSVAYNLSETRRLLRDTASYADDATPAGLARACLPLINDKARRLEAGVKAKALADRDFNWTKEADKYRAVYEGLFNGKRA